MERLKNVKYLIVINVVFIIVCILSCYFIINSKSNKCDCPKCETTSDEIISDNKDDSQVYEEKKDNSYCENVTTNVCVNSVYELIGSGDNYILDDDLNIRTISDKISLVNYSKYADIEVVDGSLVFKIHEYSIDSIKGVVIDDSLDKFMNYNIPGEKIKYIYTFYYQPSGDTFIYLLTDNNNLYKSKYKHLIKENEYDFNSVIDFKLVCSNVSDMKLISVPFYNESGNISYINRLHAVINGETVEVQLNE